MKKKFHLLTFSVWIDDDVVTVVVNEDDDGSGGDDDYGDCDDDNDVCIRWIRCPWLSDWFSIESFVAK